MNKEYIKSESGLVIVEASIVFPVMFLVLFLLIYAGNAYFQIAHIEAVVEKKAVEGANYCVDPILESIKEGKEIPSQNDLDLDPYRYIFGGMKDIEKKIAKEVKSEISGDSQTLFTGMKPVIRSQERDIASYNSYIVYSTFSVEVEYQIELPIKMLGSNKAYLIRNSARAEIPVNDTPDFIRNTDMAMDYLEDTKAGKSISSMFGKINEFIGNFTKK